MKHLINIAFLISFLNLAFAQQTQYINYQGVARNNEGTPITNSNLSVRLSILTNSENGNTVYQETHNITTNSFGLFNLKIGSGSTSTGNYSTIDWGNSTMWLKTEIDINGGSNYVDLGTSQFVSVPYALYAEKSGSDGLWTQENTNIDYSGGKVTIGNAEPIAPLNIAYTKTSGNQNGLELRNQSTHLGAANGVRLYAGNDDNFGALVYANSNYNIVPELAATTIIQNKGNGIVFETLNSNAPIKFMFRNNSYPAVEYMRVSSTGELGIGTTDPKAKIHISSGDIYIEDSSKGVILTSPNGSCFRITVDDNGNLTTTPINCP